MKPRFTISLSNDNVFEININEAARDLLIKELSNLNDKNEHVHLSSNWPAEIELSQKKYSPTDTLLNEGKILFRKDEWDKQYYPHVLED